MVENNKPIKVYKAGVITLNLWENETVEGKMKSFTFSRSYKDKEDNWQSTQSLRTSDLPKMKILIDEAYKDLVLSSSES